MWNIQQILTYMSAFCVISSSSQESDKNINYNQKLNIDILYESLCPDSYTFISKQLHPIWNNIAQHVNLKFIPFGKSASLENGTKFVCQHGAVECKGNRIMSCVLSRIRNPTKQVAYVNCFMEVYRSAIINANEYGQECAELLALDFQEILENCYQTKQGTTLQLAAENDTKIVSPKFIPTIVYNGLFNQQLQDESLKDFGDVVYRLLKETNPEACNYESTIAI